MITKIWGTNVWKSLWYSVRAYPDNPNEEQQQDMYNSLLAARTTLPCGICRNSYRRFITLDGTMLTKDTVSSKESVSRWLYNLKEAVNKKLGTYYGLTYEEVIKSYDTSRSQCIEINGDCITPADLRKIGYENAKYLDAPFVHLDIIKPILEYAVIRGFDREKAFAFYEIVNNAGYNVELRKTEIWKKRNVCCRKKINKIRLEALPTLETDGLYIGLPTIDELDLLILLSSELSLYKLQEISLLLVKKNAPS